MKSYTQAHAYSIHPPRLETPLPYPASRRHSPTAAAAGGAEAYKRETMGTMIAEQVYGDPAEFPPISQTRTQTASCPFEPCPLFLVLGMLQNTDAHANTSPLHSGNVTVSLVFANT